MDLPALDCHAHISVDVTERQVRDLRNAVVFAMTRSPAEAAAARQRYDRNLIWGCGAHPSNVAKGEPVDPEQFLRRSRHFALVGEVGLDRRSGNLGRQQSVLESLLDVLAEEPVLVSMHSAGTSTEITRVLSGRRCDNIIMHWFTGAEQQLGQLLAYGCYFSVNTAMHRDLLRLIPLEKLLPETDFPVARKRTGARPGDTIGIETLLGELHGMEPQAIRRECYRNLRRLTVRSGAIDRLPQHLADLLLLA